MPEKRIEKKASGVKKTSPLKKLLVFLAVILVAGNCYLFYYNYRTQLTKRLAEEQRKLAEEEAKKQQQKLLAEKKNEFDQILTEIKNLIKVGRYQQAQKLMEKAFALARQYKFPEDQLQKMLQEIDVHRYSDTLARLEKEAEDIFLYQYVRGCLRKIPRLPGLSLRWNRLMQKTYQNEYLVCLFLSEKTVRQGLLGQESSLNYSLSKTYLNQALQISEKHRVIPEKDKEAQLMILQKNLFFQDTSLQNIAIPGTLYRVY